MRNIVQLSGNLSSRADAPAAHFVTRYLYLCPFVDLAATDVYQVWC